MSDRFDDLFNNDITRNSDRDSTEPTTEEILKSYDYKRNDSHVNIADNGAVYGKNQPHTDIQNAQSYYRNTNAEQNVYEQPPQPYHHTPSNVHVDYKEPATDYHSYNEYAPAQQPVKKKKEKKKVGLGFVAVMLLVCIFFSSAFGFFASLVYTKLTTDDVKISDNGAMVVNKVDIDEQTAQTLADKSTAQITDEVADTVVEITTEQLSSGWDWNSWQFGQYITQGAGSGVIISSDGYIVTNNHVIEGATSITVTLRDQSTYEAQLVGTDSMLDIALLKVEATDLHAAVFGDSDKLSVGDKAVAIGNPLGHLGGTVTEGIISALDRDLVMEDETRRLLQTDTAINPGNSGGGLFDGQGALIGIVVAKSTGEDVDNLGFAIPINDVEEVLDDLKEFGHVRRADTGLTLIDSNNPQYSQHYFGNDEIGCYVASVAVNSPAHKADIRGGDRIVSVNGKQISKSSEVEAELKNAQVGETVTFEIDRQGNMLSIDVLLDDYYQQTQQSQYDQNDMMNPYM